MNIMKSQAISPMLVDNTTSLEMDARLAVGPNNLYNIQSSIPFDKLRRAKGSGGLMFPYLVPFRSMENQENGIRRFLSEGYLLGDVGEVCRFMARYPEEVEKYNSVFALDEGSRWEDESSRWRDKNPFTYVAYASIEDGKRCLRRFRFDRILGPEDCALVFRSRSLVFYAPI